MKVSLSHYIAVGRGGLYEQEAEKEPDKDKNPRSLSVKRVVFLRVFNVLRGYCKAWIRTNCSWRGI